ncbi:MAG TPA: insulinase family protein, partial [Pseudonocardiaceae bacterium]|nr:insulinase family protein [Pseudonocardiaceae bacterium]
MTARPSGTITTHRLDNGMTLVAAPDPAATTVAMSITWRVGFVDDPDSSPGLAHLIEHLMFQGTRRHARQDYYRTYFGSGGCTNAYTRTGHTTYHAEFPAQLLPAALELEADRFGDFAPSRQAVAQECALIAREIAETTGARPLGSFPWEQVQATLF